MAVAQMAALMRCEGHLPYRGSGNSCPLFASPLGGHLTTEDQSRPLTSIRVNVFSSSKRNFDFQVAFAE